MRPASREQTSCSPGQGPATLRQSRGAWPRCTLLPVLINGRHFCTFSQRCLVGRQSQTALLTRGMGARQAGSGPWGVPGAEGGRVWAAGGRSSSRHLTSLPVWLPRRGAWPSALPVARALVCEFLTLWTPRPGASGTYILPLAWSHQPCWFSRPRGRDVRARTDRGVALASSHRCTWSLPKQWSRIARYRAARRARTLALPTPAPSTQPAAKSANLSLDVKPGAPSCTWDC